jgi:hypothetical protein
MSAPSDHARERMLNAILTRAASDPVFRAGLLSQPKETINEVFGVTIPPQFRLRFIEKEADLDALVVLPDLRVEGAELSERDLDVVNGGGDISLFNDEPW